jgi:hypothetical protein
VLRPDTGQAFINTETNWRWLKEDASKAARWLGYVPFYQIRDERNEPAELYGTDGAIIEPRGMRRLAASPGDMAAEVPALSEMLPTLSLKGGTSPRQPFRIALIGEKSSLGEVLRPIAQEVGAEPLLSSGDCSETHVAEMAERAAADSRPFVVLYFSDFDPGGWGMPIVVARTFRPIATCDIPIWRCKCTRSR